MPHWHYILSTWNFTLGLLWDFSSVHCKNRCELPEMCVCAHACMRVCVCEIARFSCSYCYSKPGKQTQDKVANSIQTSAQIGQLFSLTFRQTACFWSNWQYKMLQHLVASDNQTSDLPSKSHLWDWVTKTKCMRHHQSKWWHSQRPQFQLQQKIWHKEADEVIKSQSTAFQLSRRQALFFKYHQNCMF